MIATVDLKLDGFDSVTMKNPNPPEEKKDKS
jgi:hypothetical protein